MAGLRRSARNAGLSPARHLESCKVLLLTDACFQRHWERLPPACRDWVRLAKEAVEGEVSRHQLDDAFEAMEEALNELGPPGEFVALLDLAWGMWLSGWRELEADSAGHEERKAQAILVREVFGNPFRPVSINPTGSGPTVLAVARSIEAERAFKQLPVLGGCAGGCRLRRCGIAGPLPWSRPPRARLLGGRVLLDSDRT